jgi:hypothetical protein
VTPGCARDGAWVSRARGVTVAAACALGAAWALGACGDDACGFAGDAAGTGPDAGGDPDAGPDAKTPVAPEVIVGVPGDPATLEFVPLEPGGNIALETFGQGGTHAELAVRAIGFSKRAFVVVTLENLVSGEIVMSPEPVRPQLLLCRDEAETTCDLIPLLVLTGGLAEPGKKNGLHIEVTADVHNAAGLEGTASVDGYLRAPE